MKESNDFLDNLANHQHQKMLREIANDKITPKKRDTRVQNDLYDEDGLDYDDQTMIIT
tara:strand:+ start:140 stop:313 length:174 start_codon:yes stop_codon:yes gene_type:complete